MLPRRPASRCPRTGVRGKFFQTMKTILALCLFLAVPLQGGESFRLKNRDGKIISFEVENLAADSLVGYVKSDPARRIVRWKDLDLDWLRAEEPALHKRYLAAVKEAEAAKDYDPTEDIRKSVWEITQKMSGVKVAITDFARDASGKVIRVPLKAAPLEFGRTYDYLGKIINNLGEDGRKTYHANTRTAEFRPEAIAMDARLLNLAAEVDSMLARLEKLPRVKESPKNSATLAQIRTFAESVRKLRTETSALDRTACENIKKALEYFKAL